MHGGAARRLGRERREPVAQDAAATEAELRASLEEIRYWEQTGVIDDALSGKAPSRRDYTCSLMNNLLQNRYYTWFHEQDEWDAILRKLWDAGASKHTHLHAIWLRALPGHWLFDVMLDAGVSPFSPGSP